MDPKQKHMEVLAYIAVGAFISIVYMLMFVAIPSASENVLFTLLGALVMVFKDIYGYYFGSSKSSNDKTEMMAKTAKEAAKG
jgi:hypothetical protein